MKRWMVLSLALVFVFAAVAMAEEKMDKDQACSLIGDCGNDMVESAKAMQVECDKMMADAEKLMEKGKMVKGQGTLWGDKEMEADGQAIYDQGKIMWDQAKAMSDTCALIIAEGEKKKKKYSGKGSYKEHDKMKATGDHTPQ